MAKILLVEDDNNLREIYEPRLQAEGYEIVSARDGEEALTVAMKERPDLIISDVMMPKISGFDMLDIIRSTEETKNVKVIMMTALSQAEDKERATKLGADRYLVKSQVTLEDVAKVAREVLDGASDQNEPETPAFTAPTVTQTPAVEAPTVPTPAPIVADPVTVTEPTDEPMAIPAPVVADDTTAAAPVADNSATDNSASAALAAISPVPIVDTSSSDNTDTANTTEESAIAAQIESFIEVKKTEPDTTVAEEPKAPAEQEAAVAVTAKEITDASEKKGKIVIQPISNPNESKGPNLEELVKKEVEKEQMAEIAKSIATQKTDVADELTAEAALRSAARAPHNTAEEETSVDAPQVNITENGDLKVQSPPEETAVQEPEVPKINTSDVPKVETAASVDPDSVIPHSNGSSMDGVVPQPSAVPASVITEPTKTPIESPETEAKDDPNAIAL
jgi:CheY-like chemotaxis protein